MKIIPLILITLGTLIVTGLFATTQAPIPPLSAQDYMRQQIFRIADYEFGLSTALINYEKLIQTTKSNKMDAKQILSEIAMAIEKARKPYAPLMLKDPKDVTQSEKATIDQLDKLNTELLTALDEIEKKAQDWAKKKHIEFPQNVIVY